MPNNPASRAHELFAKAKVGKGPVHRVWAATFGLSEITPIDDVVDLLHHLSTQLKLAEDETKQRFSPATASVKLKHFPNLKQAIFSFDLNGGFEGSVRTVLTEAALDSLQSLAHDLEDEGTVEPSEIHKIRKELDELFTLFDNSDLPNKLKQFVLNWLSMIGRALDLFQITGTKGLQDALVVLQGEAYLLSPVTAKISATTPTLWQRLTSLWTSACSIAEFTERCRRICKSPVAQLAIDFGIKHIGGSDSKSNET